MKGKGFWITMLALTLLVSNFFVVLLSMASNNNHSIADEWKSWWSVQEETVDSDLDGEISTEVQPEVEEA